MPHAAWDFGDPSYQIRRVSPFSRVGTCGPFDLPPGVVSDTWLDSGIRRYRARLKRNPLGESSILLTIRALFVSYATRISK